MFGRKDKTIIEGDGGSSSAAGKDAVGSPEAVDVNGTSGGGGGGGSGVGVPNGGSSGLNNDGLIDPKKLGTRVFKKSSPNGKITT